MSPIDLTDSAQFGFPPGLAIHECSPQTRSEINQARLRIQGSDQFQRFWDRVLTEEERESLGGDVVVCQQNDPISVNHLTKLRHWIPEQAVIEIAYQLNFLSQQDCEWLLKEVGVSPETGEVETAVGNRPVWNREAGKLELRGEVIRSIRVAIATSLVRILDQFEELAWPVSVPNPIVSDDPQNIHSVVKSLNENLTSIRFYVQGDHICWRFAV